MEIEIEILVIAQEKGESLTNYAPSFQDNFQHEVEIEINTLFIALEKGVSRAVHLTTCAPLFEDTFRHMFQEAALMLLKTNHLRLANLRN